jgi:predicted ATPase with chaperone activity
MIAKRIPSILPLLTLREAIETTKVHSVLLITERRASICHGSAFSQSASHNL